MDNGHFQHTTSTQPHFDCDLILDFWVYSNVPVPQGASAFIKRSFLFPFASTPENDFIVLGQVTLGFPSEPLECLCCLPDAKSACLRKPGHWECRSLFTIHDICIKFIYVSAYSYTSSFVIILMRASFVSCVCVLSTVYVVSLCVGLWFVFCRPSTWLWVRLLSLQLLTLLFMLFVCLVACWSGLSFWLSVSISLWDRSAVARLSVLECMSVCSALRLFCGCVSLRPVLHFLICVCVFSVSVIL